MVGVFIILLSLKASVLRPKALLLFFVMSAICTALTIVAHFITIVVCWNHKEIKPSYFLFYLQTFSLLTTTLLLWEAIQYGYVARDAKATYYSGNKSLKHLEELMKAGGDFYNILSGVAAKEAFYFTGVIASIVWINLCYQKECFVDEQDDLAPQLVTL